MAFLILAEMSHTVQGYIAGQSGTLRQESRAILNPISSSSLPANTAITTVIITGNNLTYMSFTKVIITGNDLTYNLLQSLLVIT